MKKYYTRVTKDKRYYFRNIIYIYKYYIYLRFNLRKVNETTK